MNSKESISLSINKLKFPLTVGVVFIHNQLKVSNEISISGQHVPIPDTAWYEAVINLFSYVLPCIAVPVFFCISGYLFFKERVLDKYLYINKLKKRFKSLVIPYFLWNTLGLLIFLTVRLPFLHSLFPNTSLKDVTLNKILSGYWACEGNGFPFDYPLWYVRELILVVIISPLLYLAVKKWKSIFLIIVGICCFCNLCPAKFSLTLYACFFFSLGIWAQLFPEKIEYIKRLNIKYLYVSLVIVNIYTVTYGLSINSYIKNLVILSGVLCVFHYIFLSTPKRTKAIFHEESFFIFASHGLFMAFLQKAVLKITNPTTEIGFLIVYFFVPLLTIAFLLGIYRYMKSATPKMLSVFTGGR
jgi:Acyltransferase family.